MAVGMFWTVVAFNNFVIESLWTLASLLDVICFASTIRFMTLPVVITLITDC